MTPSEIARAKKIEEISEKIHHVYCNYFLEVNWEAYWTNGDYSKLDEKTKEADRYIARFILKHIEELEAHNNLCHQMILDKQVRGAELEAKFNVAWDALDDIATAPGEYLTSGMAKEAMEKIEIQCVRYEVQPMTDKQEEGR